MNRINMPELIKNLESLLQTVKEINKQNKEIIIRHEKISNYTKGA